MSSLPDLITELGKDDDLEFQLLNNALKSKILRGRKGDKHSQLTFLSEERRMNFDQEAIIIWTTPEKFNQALAAIKKNK